MNSLGFSVRRFFLYSRTTHTRISRELRAFLGPELVDDERQVISPEVLSDPEALVQALAQEYMPPPAALEDEEEDD